MRQDFHQGHAAHSLTVKFFHRQILDIHNQQFGIVYLRRWVGICRQNGKTAPLKPVREILDIANGQARGRKGQFEDAAFTITVTGRLANAIFRLVEQLQIALPHGAQAQQHAACENAIKIRMRSHEKLRLFVHGVNIPPGIGDFRLEQRLGFRPIV